MVYNQYQQAYASKLQSARMVFAPLLELVQFLICASIVHVYESISLHERSAGAAEYLYVISRREQRRADGKTD